MATATLVTTNITVLDDADSNTQWSADRSLTGPDTELYYEASGAMGCTIQAATNADDIWITKTTGTWDLSNTHIRLWYFFTAIGQLDTDANSGIQFGVADASNTGWWDVSGSTTYKGGWKLLQVDTRLAVDAGTKPSMTAITDVYVKTTLTSSPKNAQNLWTDYWHETDAGYEVYGGTSGDKITWADIATADRNAGYGIVQEIDGVYFVSGPVQIGSGTQTTYFEWTTETVVFVDNLVDSGFYAIVGYGANTDIDIDGGTLVTLADNADFDMNETGLSACAVDGLVLQGSGATYFKSGQTVYNTKFVDRGQITHGGADFDTCTFIGYEGTANTSYLIYNVNADPDGELDGCSFTKGTAATHAIEFGTTSPLTMTLRNCSFSGYNASDSQDDSTFHFKRTSGSVTLNLVSPTGNVSYRSDGADVTIQTSVDLTVTVKDEAGNLLDNVQTAIYKTSDRTQLMNEDTVSGVATESFNYVSDTEVEVRCRKASSGATKYINYSSVQTIGSTGLNLSVTLEEDTNNNATS